MACLIALIAILAFSLLHDFAGAGAMTYTPPTSSRSGHYRILGRRQSLINYFQAEIESNPLANTQIIQGKGKRMLISKSCASGSTVEQTKVGSERVTNMDKRVGSSLPSCTMQCEHCTPCVVVHVPVHPKGQKHNQVGLLEYYPEAWRCKCKNRLFEPGVSPHP
ncbi:hypothetical protein L7F22_031382 [Adiantum nelumboides]|nr:hypothetical protein [Adiantum nelumboides]